MRIDEVGGPGEVLLLDVLGGQAEFPSAGLHGSHIAVLLDFAAHTRGVDDTDQVVVVTLVPVEGGADAVVEETGLEADIQLVLLLVGELAVGQLADIQRRLTHIGGRTPGGMAPDHDGGVGHVLGAAVCRQGVGGFYAQVRNRIRKGIPPRLVADVPGTGNVPGRKPAGAAALAQFVRTLVPVGAVDYVPAFVRVSAVGEEGGAAVVAI